MKASPFAWWYALYMIPVIFPLLSFRLFFPQLFPEIHTACQVVKNFFPKYPKKIWEKKTCLQLKSPEAASARKINAGCDTVKSVQCVKSSFSHTLPVSLSPSQLVAASMHSSTVSCMALAYCVMARPSSPRTGQKKRRQPHSRPLK